ncbi:MAG: cytochrome c3 family protein [Planctomycetes bacterium]|nr:cytochrome c3 family protein [Planctomycetota bacterium]
MSESDSQPKPPGAYTHIIGPLTRYWYIVGFVLVFLGIFFLWWRFFAFTDEGYKPRQPIAYSHKLHAGDLKIPCQYCHFNADKSRHAGVPPLSICLGCHAPDKGAVANDKPEIEELLKLTIDAPGAYGSDDDSDYRDSGVLKSGGMIHWNRVHQLPDHVYFSHEWHVKAGVSCQTCHGDIENMVVVKQVADLTMGWCVRCHRKDNYVSYNSKRSGLQNSYDEKEAASFVVGTGNYDVLRHNVRPDDLPVFSRRDTKAKYDTGEDHGHEHDAGNTVVDDNSIQKLRGNFIEDRVDGKEKLLNSEYFTTAQASKLQELFKKYPDLPRWRISDLPETHQAFYGKEGGKGMHQNAPTQCSTCHQ